MMAVRSKQLWKTFATGLKITMGSKSNESKLKSKKIYYRSQDFHEKYAKETITK